MVASIKTVSSCAPINHFREIRTHTIDGVSADMREAIAGNRFEYSSALMHSPWGIVYNNVLLHDPISDILLLVKQNAQ